MPPHHPVLIVDDEPALRRTLTRMLTNLGRSSISCGSVEESLPLMASNTFDVVLLDLHLPGASGHELLRALNAHRIDVPVIMMSGGGDMDDVILAFRERAVDFLQKPFTTNTLAKALDRLEHTGRHTRVADMRAPRVGAPGTDGDLARLIRETSARLTGGSDDIPDVRRIAADLAQLTRRSDVPARQVVTLLTRAPSVAARVLQVANTAFYRGQNQITNLQDALVRLGARTIIDIAVTTESATLHDVNHVILGPWLRQLWEHSVMTAHIAKGLAPPLLDAHDTYLAALFRDVGHAVIIRRLAKKLGPERLDPQDKGTILDEVTRAQRDVGAAILRSLDFPMSAVRVASECSVHGRSAVAMAQGRDPTALRMALLCDRAALLAERAGHPNPLPSPSTLAADELLPPEAFPEDKLTVALDSARLAMAAAG